MQHPWFKQAVLIFALAMTACEKGDRSFSLLAESNNFRQSATYLQKKIDILWVVDNSGSMQTSQTALVQNFSSFMTRFQALNFDFHMAVTSTDAWRGKYAGTEAEHSFYRSLRDWGAKPRTVAGCEIVQSNVPVLKRDTPNLTETFVINATQSTCGSGDERAFASIEDALTYSSNAEFRRSDAFLAVIIVSDEDDFSSTTETYLENNYNSPNLIAVSHYKDFLDGLAGASNYSVSAITIMDNECLSKLNDEFTGRRMGNRYMALADQTGGVKSSLCGDFGVSLKMISDSIIQLASTFKIDREPIISSFHITIDGVEVPNDANNGWTYDAATMTVSFHGDFIPKEGSAVSINFDPVKPR